MRHAYTASFHPPIYRINKTVTPQHPPAAADTKIGKKSIKMKFQALIWNEVQLKDAVPTQKELKETYRLKVEQEFREFVARHMEGRSSEEMFNIEDVARKFREESHRPEMNAQRVSIIIHRLGLINASIRTRTGTLISFYKKDASIYL